MYHHFAFSGNQDKFVLHKNNNESKLTLTAYDAQFDICPNV